MKNLNEKELRKTNGGASIISYKNSNKYENKYGCGCGGGDGIIYNPKNHAPFKNTI